MARTSKSRGASPFAMKSGNKTTFKMMGSSKSPMHYTGTPETYAAAIDAVTSNMSDADLTNIATEQHKKGTREWDISVKTLQKRRRQLLNLKNENVEETETPVKPITPPDEGSGQAFTISNEDRERIFTKHGGGVLKGDALAARNRDLKIAASRYRR